MLAEAFDAEELEDLDRHNRTIEAAIAFHAPKKIKKWKWRSPDKAGTLILGEGKKAVASGLAVMALQLGKGKIDAGPSSFIYERARVTGRRIIFMDPVTLEHFNEDGSPTAREPLDLIIKMTHARD